ncbi:hypothetical protein FNV43_RR06229 [Rhamnella rubrinervis]|uniref:RING-type domain-containing protein n=1 Tax=Rhamnella rubrinervis TaxID=2594499 RepID=A0A8K0HE45_9ROSA|nr:hypothetical protein FNV43_RR06229 [Rhamnella rubrinervis]
MAVEARQYLMNPVQLIANRDFMKFNQENGNIFVTEMDSTLPLAPTMAETLLPPYQSPVCDAKASLNNNKADSGLTYNIPTTRKRPRESIMDHEFNANFIVPQKSKHGVYAFLDRDIVSQIHQQQSEIDRFIAHHTETVRLELDEQRKRQTRMLVSAVEEGIAKKLKEKDEEIQRMEKLNWVLQERVRNLCVENQIWRELAQTNEAAANSLRSNLEHVLAHVGDDRQAVAGAGGPAMVEEDAESSCGSNDFGREAEERCGVPAENVAVEGLVPAKDGSGSKRNCCRGCGVRESSVLLLPCRHLCLCTTCGSHHRTCPVCSSVTTTSVHVNFS